jgi:hypothetical protein
MCSAMIAAVGISIYAALALELALIVVVAYKAISWLLK